MHDSYCCIINLTIQLIGQSTPYQDGFQGRDEYVDVPRYHPDTSEDVDFFTKAPEMDTPHGYMMPFNSPSQSITTFPVIRAATTAASPYKDNELRMAVDALATSRGEIGRFHNTGYHGDEADGDIDDVSRAYNTYEHAKKLIAEDVPGGLTRVDDDSCGEDDRGDGAIGIKLYAGQGEPINAGLTRVVNALGSRRGNDHVVVEDEEEEGDFMREGYNPVEEIGYSSEDGRCLEGVQVVQSDAGEEEVICQDGYVTVRDEKEKEREFRKKQRELVREEFQQRRERRERTLADQEDGYESYDTDFTLGVMEDKNRQEYVQSMLDSIGDNSSVVAVGKAVQRQHQQQHRSSSSSSRRLRSRSGNTDSTVVPRESEYSTSCDDTSSQASSSTSNYCCERSREIERRVDPSRADSGDRGQCQGGNKYASKAERCSMIKLASTHGYPKDQRIERMVR